MAEATRIVLIVFIVFSDVNCDLVVAQSGPGEVFRFKLVARCAEGCDFLDDGELE